MRKASTLLAAVAVAGLAIAGGAAFTGTGLTDSTGGSQFVGGTVTQTVTGATLESVTYSFSDGPANTSVSAIDLTFAGTDAVGHVVAVAANGSGNGTGSFGCTPIVSNTSSNGDFGSSHCDFSPVSLDVGQHGFSGMRSMDVTVGDIAP